MDDVDASEPPPAESESRFFSKRRKVSLAEGAADDGSDWGGEHARRALAEQSAPDDKPLPADQFRKRFTSLFHCPLCAVGFGPGIDSERCPFLFQVYNVFDRLKDKAPDDVVAQQVLEAYEEVVRKPLLNDGEECPAWTKAQITVHVKSHILVAASDLIGDIRDAKLVQERILSNCFTIDDEGRTKTNPSMCKEWREMVKFKAELFKKLSALQG